MNLQTNSLLQDAIQSINKNNLIDAKIILQKILDIEPHNFDALNIIGIVTGLQNNYIEAINFFKKAQQIRPDNNLINFNLGKAFSESGKDLEAIKYYKIAIKLDKNHLGSWINFGISLHQLKRYDEALSHYDQAIKLKPDYQYLFGKLLHVKMLMCNWQNFKTNVTSLSLQINENKKSSPCFPVLALIDSSSIQRKSSEVWVNDNYPFNSSLGPIFKSGHRDKIKIGYYSSDFKEHPVAYLLAELLELHDKNQFELFGFYFGPTVSSAIHKRVSSSFNQFIDVGLKTDKDIALMSREMGIDIAVNLNGFTALARPDIFSFRAAPIQVNYLGYPSTSGAEYMDYIIADRIIIPTESQKYYSEKVVYLPNSYQVNDRKNDIANNIFNKNMFTKKELNLPEKSFVFCCFNNSYKITPSTFDGWMRILKAVKGSVLWLLEDSPVARLNLLKEAEARGLNPDRLVFAKRMNLTEHLARHKVADLFLDTLPYNAHTTASDALWAGLPVLTCKGESFASRVAASLLNAIELPELITTTQEQYETTAIDLANNPEKLKAIKYKLESNRSTTALFDTPLYNKHIQAAYRQMYERYQADLPPNNIYIENQL